ncbi:MAG TPA: hypothetical protein VKZ89_11990 [Thermobifida alba]|jgi:hypothetical protein|nr:hypothetical protein [Thermobifida alba]
MTTYGSPSSHEQLPPEAPAGEARTAREAGLVEDARSGHCAPWSIHRDRPVRAAPEPGRRARSVTVVRSAVPERVSSGQPRTVLRHGQAHHSSDRAAVRHVSGEQYFPTGLFDRHVPSEWRP